MKAALKFREDQKPLMKAKVPISILGLPFLSGVSAGDTKELLLDLATAFEFGPALRASYRPNDPASPFAVSLRTGVGRFGSPIGAPMSMTVEFNFGGNPNFVVLFKLRLGDFSFRKVTASSRKVTASPVESDADPSEVCVEKVNGTKSAPSITPRWGIGDLLTGMEVTASSVLPFSRAAVRFKWGVRVPVEIRTAFAEDGHCGGISFNKLPLLVMSKIANVHVAEDKKVIKKKKGEELIKGIDDVAEVKKQLEVIREENEMLRKATFMPALSSRPTISTDREVGPSVHTIFVFGRSVLVVPTVAIHEGEPSKRKEGGFNGEEENRLGGVVEGLREVRRSWEGKGSGQLRRSG